MKTLKTLLILAVACTALTGTADQLQACKFGLKISIGGHNFHGKPRCSDPHRCPPRRPLPLPRPVPKCYHLGVWTTLVELVTPEEQPAAVYGEPTTQVAAGQHPTYGLQIDRLVRFSAAERAGLEPGDVLLSANGISLQCKKDLLQAIRDSHGRLILQVLDVRTGQITAVKAYPTLK